MAAHLYYVRHPYKFSRARVQLTGVFPRNINGKPSTRTHDRPAEDRGYVYRLLTESMTKV